MQANKWHCKPWELSGTGEISRRDKMVWRYRWLLWQEQRAMWRKQLDGPGTLEMIQLELMLNG